MRLLHITTCVFLAIVPVLGAPPEGYKLQWGDEFNGPALDRAKWEHRTDSKHWSAQLPGNVAAVNGNLVLTLKKEKAGDKEYTGAGVISRKAFRFGYCESRFRIDAGKGWHSSFWMMGHDGNGGTGTTKSELELLLLAALPSGDPNGVSFNAAIPLGGDQ